MGSKLYERALDGFLSGHVASGPEPRGPVTAEGRAAAIKVFNRFGSVTHGEIANAESDEYQDELYLSIGDLAAHFTAAIVEPVKAPSDSESLKRAEVSVSPIEATPTVCAHCDCFEGHRGKCCTCGTEHKPRMTLVDDGDGYEDEVYATPPPPRTLHERIAIAADELEGQGERTAVLACAVGRALRASLAGSVDYFSVRTSDPAVIEGTLAATQFERDSLLAERNKMAAELAGRRAPAQWSKEVPTEPGPYWVRPINNPAGTPFIVELFDRGLGEEAWTSDLPRWIVHYFGVSSTDPADRFVWGPRIEVPRGPGT